MTNTTFPVLPFPSLFVRVSSTAEYKPAIEDETNRRGNNEGCRNGKIDPPEFSSIALTLIENHYRKNGAQNRRDSSAKVQKSSSLREGAPGNKSAKKAIVLASDIPQASMRHTRPSDKTAHQTAKADSARIRVSRF